MAWSALACNVPVFRYALERWNPDAYEVHVFHQGPLTAEQRKLVEMMRAQVVGKERDLDSFYINEVDVSEAMEDGSRAILKAAKPTEYPFVLVRFPRSEPGDPAAYAGALTADIAGQLADSPSRREVARRILGGDSVVWVLLESGDRARDAAAAALLQEELARLAGELALPELDESDDKYHDPAAGPRLRMGFSVLRLSRAAAGEAMFIALLENWDPKQVDANEPMAFAVFGRGRVMPPLKGPHLTSAFIEDACRFLVGRCSCLVKEQNPGWDLLMPVNWDAVMKGQASLAQAMPALTTPAGIVERNDRIIAAAADALAQGADPARGPSSDGASSLLRNMLILAGVAVALTVAGTMWLRARRA
jgi:hypothetical protein